MQCNLIFKKSTLGPKSSNGFLYDSGCQGTAEEFLTELPRGVAEEFIREVSENFPVRKQFVLGSPMNWP